MKEYLEHELERDDMSPEFIKESLANALEDPDLSDEDSRAIRLLRDQLERADLPPLRRAKFQESNFKDSFMEELLEEAETEGFGPTCELYYR